MVNNENIISAPRATPTNNVVLSKGKKSPRQHEVDVLSKIITDCFDQHGKMPRTRVEFYKVGKILGRGAFG